MKLKFCLSLLVGLLSVLSIPLIISSTMAEKAFSETNLLAQVQAILPQDILWIPNTDLEGVESAVTVGDPAGSELYVLLGKMKSGAKFPAHIHPDDRITTVLSGVMYYGTGEQLDRENVRAFPAGSVIYTPAQTPHFMWAKDEQTTMQETGKGPTGLQFIPNLNSDD